MIRLKINIPTDDNDFIFESWWDNLFAASRDGMFDWDKVDEFLLENHCGRLLYSEDEKDYIFDEPPVSCVEFDTEEAAMLFLLRWA